MRFKDITESSQKCPHCGGPLVEYSGLMEKKDACYYKVKASAKVWPSAYASGRLVQCRKKGAANYGNKSESVAEGLDKQALQKELIIINKLIKVMKNSWQQQHLLQKKQELLKQLKQGVAEGVEIVGQDSDLDQQVFTLNVDGETVSFTYWDYENNFQNSDIKDIYQQAREQLGKKLSPEQIKAVARSVFKSFKSGVAEGLPQTLRKIVPGYAKREIDKKMDAEKFGRTDVDRDANYYRYKKIQDKIKNKGVAEGSETAADIDKKIEFHKQGQAAAQYRGSMNKMHAAKIRELEAKKKALKQGVAEDAVDDFLAKGGKIETGKTHKPRKVERWQGSSHIGAAGGRGSKGTVSGQAANTNPKSNKPVVSAESLGNIKMNEKYNAEYDDEAGMADNNLQTLARAVEGIDDLIQSGDNLPEWCQEKIAVAKSMLVAVWDYMYSEEASEEVDPEIDAMFEAMDQLVHETAHAQQLSVDLVWESFEALPDHMLYETAAWRRKEGKSKKGGLNAKGVASYRRENPGSKLQMAVTTKPSKLKPGSKAAKRRKSFCARMSGVKGPMKKPNGKPTRKALALRKWNC